MKEIYISEIGDREVVQDFFMVKSAAIRIGSNRKEYFDIMLGDKTGEISGKKWDVAGESEELSQIKAGDLVKIRANVVEWNGSKQLRITKIRLSMPNDNLIIGDYISAAPEDPKEMYDYIYERARNIEDQQLKDLCTGILEEERDRLLYYPAATKNHHAQLGGLLYHMKRMLMNGDGICQVYDILDSDLVATGVILHDMQKLNLEYEHELATVILKIYYHYKRPKDIHYYDFLVSSKDD